MKNFVIRAMFALVCISCSPHSPERPSPEVPVRSRGSAVFSITSAFPLRDTTVFVFDSAGRRADPSSLLPGDYTAALFANVPGQFNPEAVSSLAQLENVAYPFDALGLDQGSWQAILPASCVAQFTLEEPVQTRVELNMSILTAAVVVRSIANRHDPDTLMENPRVRILDANAAAEPLRWSGFSPAGTVDIGPVPLPCDIGLMTRYPDLPIFVFPSDLPDAMPHPRLELSWEAKGRTFCEKFELPMLRRGGTVYMDL